VVDGVGLVGPEAVDPECIPDGGGEGAREVLVSSRPFGQPFQVDEARVARELGAEGIEATGDEDRLGGQGHRRERR
jgi:hypothetical protein